MKNIFIILGLLTASPLFAANNKFTFQVNSSGANMYVCGFEFQNKEHGINNATWDEVEVTEWTGAEKRSSHTLADFNAGMNTGKINYDYVGRIFEEAVGSTGTYHKIENLELFLNSENFGAEYNIYVCYNVPLYLDINKTKFKVDADIVFPNLLNGRDYVAKSGLIAKYRVENGAFLDDLPGQMYPLNRSETTRLPISNLTASTSYTDVFFDRDSVANEHTEYVIRTVYKFKEGARDVKRPHVAHGGTFKLMTEVTPIAK